MHNDRTPNFVPTMLAIIFNKFTPKHASSLHCEPLFIIIFFKFHAHAHKKHLTLEHELNCEMRQGWWHFILSHKMLKIGSWWASGYGQDKHKSFNLDLHGMVMRGEIWQVNEMRMENIVAGDDNSSLTLTAPLQKQLQKWFAGGALRRFNTGFPNKTTLMSNCTLQTHWFAKERYKTLQNSPWPWVSGGKIMDSRCPPTTLGNLSQIITYMIRWRREKTLTRIS